MAAEKTFDTSELLLNYVEIPSDGPPLVMLHGLTGTWQGCTPFFPYMTPQYHVYACDLRGHGKSGRIDEGFRLTDYARDIAAFVRQEIKEPTILLGHSLGAMTSLATAAAAPETVRALVLLDPPLNLRSSGVEATPWAVDWFGFVYQTMKSAKSYADVLASCKRRMPDAEDAAATQLADSIAHVAPDTVGMALSNRVVTIGEIDEMLQKIICPTLLLHGDWDHGAPVRDEDIAAVTSLVPQAVIGRFPDAGHGFPYEQTEETMQQVHTFLNSL